MAEEWRLCAQLPEVEISDQGRLRYAGTEDLIIPSAAGGRQYRCRKICYLVLEAFIGPRPEGMECCHWNDDPDDNRLENLRWDTHSANCRDAFRNGINPGRTGIPHTPESRQKISVSNKGRSVSEVQRRRVSETWKGRKHSEESLRKMAEVKKGKTHSEETRKKMSEAWAQRKAEGKQRKKWKCSEESRRRISEAAKKREEAKRALPSLR